jgi:YfiH family protein
MIVNDLLKDQDGIRHGFFTRRGGVSEGVYRSLNCGFGSSDAAEKVQENRERVAAKLGTEREKLLTVRQVHSSRAIVADAVWLPGEQPEGDALVTTARGLAIGALTADCTPILFSDSEAGVVGAAHAGWRGAKGGIIEAVLGTMEKLGARRDRILAAIGPTISQSAYEVGEEFRDAFLADGAGNETFFARLGGGKPHFDLPGYCRQRLASAGIEKVEDLGLCTYENESLFYSYRRSVHRSEQDYGRQISAIVLM